MTILRRRVIPGSGSRAIRRHGRRRVDALPHSRALESASGFERHQVTQRRPRGSSRRWRRPARGVPGPRAHRFGFQLLASWASKCQVYLRTIRLRRVAGERRLDVNRRLRASLSRSDGGPELDNVRPSVLSVEGWIPATLATRDSRRSKKLVLMGPAGLRVPAHRQRTYSA